MTYAPVPGHDSQRAPASMNAADIAGPGPLLVLVVVVLGMVLLVAWIVLPFAVLGTKRILRELLRQQQRSTQLLEDIARRLPPPPDPPSTP